MTLHETYLQQEEEYRDKYNCDCDSCVAVAKELRKSHTITLFEKLKGELEGKKCRRCSMPLSECSKKRWEKPSCVVNGTEWDQHVIGLSGISLIDDFIKKLKG